MASEPSPKQGQDRGFNQDMAPEGRVSSAVDPKYRDASYLGTDDDTDDELSPSGGDEDEEEVRDLGFIVDDHDDRRGTLLGGWQRLQDLDTDEPLETNRSGPIPHKASLQERGAPGEWFATDYNVSNAVGERQEEDFVESSMLSSDPDMEDGVDDFTSTTLTGGEHGFQVTDITGRVLGVTHGLGTSSPQDVGTAGFQIRDNPMVHDAGEMIMPEDVSDEALGFRDLADAEDMLVADEIDTLLADRAAQDAEGQGGR